MIRKEYPKAKGSIKLAYYNGNHYNAILSDADKTTPPQTNRPIPEVGAESQGIINNDEQQEGAAR